MTHPIEWLPPLPIEGHQPSGLGTPQHPMRMMTRRIAGLEPGGWDRTAREEVAHLFDQLAPEWHTRTSPERTEVVRDALERGLGDDGGGSQVVVEVGSGIGTYSSLVAERFGTAVSMEVSMEMARRAPAAPAHRVLGDGGLLPVRDDSVDAVVLINAFLFPSEVDRVLQVGGALIWVNSSGDQTPIHLSTADLVAALPFRVEGRESRAGAGTWCVLRRVG